MESIVLVAEGGRGYVINLDVVALVEDRPEEESVVLRFLDRYELSFHGPDRLKVLRELLRVEPLLAGAFHGSVVFSPVDARAEGVGVDPGVCGVRVSVVGADGAEAAGLPETS